MRKVLFTIGKGFNSRGFLTNGILSVYCNDFEFSKLDNYLEDVFYNFKDLPNFYDELDDEDIEIIRNHVFDFDKNEVKQEISEILAKYDIELDEIGLPALFIGDYPKADLEDLTEDEGRIEIDGEYDTFYWKPINESLQMKKER